MSPGIVQRMAVAITLMGMLLLSVGAGVSPAQHAAHACCMHMSMPCGSANASCCVADSQTPPATTPVLPGITAPDAAQEFLSAGGATSRQATIVAVVPSQSPPPGIFILRI
jgi:hypothetical protein